MPADIVAGIQRVIFGGSTNAVAGSSIGTSTTALGLVTREAAKYAATVTVRASTDYNASLTSTETSVVVNYGALGYTLCIDQSAVAASSGGGGTGAMTHTIQLRDPLSGNYIGSTGVVTTSTAVSTWIQTCYPGVGSVAPTSAATGKADIAFPTNWRVSSVATSSATNFTYSIAAVPLPASGSSS